MLQSIRNRSKGILAFALFALLILSFAAWGVGDMLTGGQVPAVAKVGDREITLDTFSMALNREMRRLQTRFGPEFNIEEARRFGVFDQVAVQLVNQTVLDLAAEDAGVRVSDDVIRADIRANPAFRGPTGAFDRANFERALFNVGLSEGSYVAQRRVELAQIQLAGSILSGAAAPAPLVDRLVRYREERRIAEIVVVEDAAMTDMRAPDAMALDTFHRENAAAFMAPEFRALTVVSLDAADLAAGINVPEAALREAYEARSEEFEQPERRRFEQMILDDEGAARRARERLGTGAAFAAIVEELTGGPPIEIGPIGRPALASQDSALADAVFATAAGEAAQPVETAFGWHILRVVEVEPARTVPFGEARPGLKDAIAAERAIDVLFELANDLDDALGGGATLEDAAAGLDLPIRAIPAIDAEGRGPDGTAIEGLPDTAEFLSTAFATEEGMDSLLTEVGADAYFVLRIDAVTPSATRPLDSIREQVIAAWRADRQATAAEAAAQATRDRLKAGANARALAAELGYRYTTSPAFTRTGAGAEGTLSAELAARLFGVLAGGVVVGAVPGGVAAARLTEIVHTPPGTDEAAVAAARREVRAAIGADLLDQFERALRAEYGVTFNPAAYDRLL